MGFFSKLLGGGKSKNDLIRELFRKRLQSDPAARSAGFPPSLADSLSLQELLSLPEAGIVTNVETYLTLKQRGVHDQDIFAMIEEHRSVMACGEMPSNCTLRTYIRYRVTLETEGRQPISDDFVEAAIGESLAYFSEHGL